MFSNCNFCGRTFDITSQFSRKEVDLNHERISFDRIMIPEFKKIENILLLDRVMWKRDSMESLAKKGVNIICDNNYIAWLCYRLNVD